MLDFIYPPMCISCNTSLPNGTKKICDKCWGTIPALAMDHFLYHKTRTKLINEGYIDDLISCYVFEKEGPFQHIAHALKYQEYKSLGIELGKRIGELTRNLDGEIDIIIPIPLHRIKYRERGYNQSECIAKGIASVINKPIIVNAIRRVRHTQTQTKLNLQERYINMRDAFELLPDAASKLYAKSCLLVDDVITTGATTNSCAKEIFSTGTKTIIAASAALAK